MSTKEEIIKAALKLFLKKGFYNVSMQDIARKVGISKPAIYHHFKNKEEMINGVMDLFTLKTRSLMKNYYNNTDNYKKSLENFFNMIPIFKNVENLLLEGKCEINHTFNEFLLSISRYNPEFKKRISEDILGAINKKSNMNIKAIEKREIRQDIDPKTLALMMHAIVEGLSFIYEIIPDDNMNENIKKVFELFWTLIKK
jgi:AcrR family transcriptional regulator